MKFEDKEQDEEDLAYLNLIENGFKVEISEGYIPMNLRRYEVTKDNKIVFKGNFREFVKFAEGMGVMK